MWLADVHLLQTSVALDSESAILKCHARLFDASPLWGQQQNVLRMFSSLLTIEKDRGTAQTRESLLALIDGKFSSEFSQLDQKFRASFYAELAELGFGREQFELCRRSAQCTARGETKEVAVQYQRLARIFAAKNPEQAKYLVLMAAAHFDVRGLRNKALIALCYALDYCTDPVEMNELDLLIDEKEVVLAHYLVPVN
ncbi:MAG: hypothetical protein ABH823_01825 [bacterium]